MHGLEDRKPRHQPRRQRRVSGLVGIDRAEPLLEKAPVDRPPETWLAGGPCRRSGRAAPGTDRSDRCPAAPWAASNSTPPPRRRRDRITIKTTRSICKKRNQQPPLSCKRNNLTILGDASKIRRLRIVHGRLLRWAMTSHAYPCVPRVLPSPKRMDAKNSP